MAEPPPETRSPRLRELQRRARWWQGRARTEAGLLRSARRTALRVPDGQGVPAPRRFGSFGEESWLIPPMRTRSPHRIAIGRDVHVLEFSTLWALDDGTAGAHPLIVLADGVRLTRFCTVVAEVGVTIGEQVASSDMVAILDTWQLPMPGSRLADVPLPAAAPVVIGAGAYLGMNSIIGPGVHVGEGAYVGENAVVTEDVPAHSVVQGNPAAVVRELRPIGPER